jgi:aminoglycoside 6'-N-acetyltransferase
VLDGDRIVLRPLGEPDIPHVVAMNALPEVARWWEPREPDYVRAKLDEENQACWVVELEGDVIGYVQAYEETHREYRHAGLDLFLRPEMHGCGLGQDIVRTVCRYLVDRGHHRIVIDPAEANVRAIRCYEAVGFRRVGILREYWWDHVEKRWANGVLLDLLAGELA